MNKPISKAQLRSKLRKRRASLSKAELDKAAAGIANNARYSNRLLQAKRIASYAPFAGEASPEALIEKLVCKAVYLPKIVNFRLKKIQFYPANNSDNVNCYGITEPNTKHRPRTCNQLDIILVPLVAFDRYGSRIGMGAGYYDRAMQSLEHQVSTKPLLIGIAHHFQEVSKIKRETWDIPLDAILTDYEFIHL